MEEKQAQIESDVISEHTNELRNVLFGWLKLLISRRICSGEITRHMRKSTITKFITPMYLKNRDVMLVSLIFDVN